VSMSTRLADIVLGALDARSAYAASRGLGSEPVNRGTIYKR
jgi:hypothetical protein